MTCFRKFLSVFRKVVFLQFIFIYLILFKTKKIKNTDMKRVIILLLMMLSLSAFAQKKVAVYVTGSDPINEIIGNRLVDGLAWYN